MVDLLSETDSALKSNDSSYMRVIYKVYGDLFRAVLPYIRDKHVHDIIAKTVQENQQQQAEVKNGCVNATSVNR